jgi:Ran GTPase-activating protein (RanGAP) involved in mRNA processing and transport
MSDPNDSTTTIDSGRAVLSSNFLEFCANVRKNDPSILPEPGQPLRIRDDLSGKEDIELADALLESTSVTYLLLDYAKNFTKSSAEAMAKYVRTSKHLQQIDWLKGDSGRELNRRQEIICCFLHAIQESASLEELRMELPPIGGPSNLAFGNMLANTQSLRFLSLSCPAGQLEDFAVAAASSGLKHNTSLRELTLEFPPFPRVATYASPIFASLRKHPLIRRLCLKGNVVDLTGLNSLLLRGTSKITELEINRAFTSLPVIGFRRVLRALARRPTLTKLELRRCHLGRDVARLLWMALCNTPNLQSLDLESNELGSAGLAKLAPALYHNTSIEVLHISSNGLSDMESAEILQRILQSNQKITTLDLSRNHFGNTTGAVDCIAEGLGSNSTLIGFHISGCSLGDDSVSTLAQTIGSRNTTLQELVLGDNFITSAGVGVLLGTMERNSHHITALELDGTLIGDEGASLIAVALGNNALPSLTRLFLSYCGIDDDGFIALMLALKQNISLLELVLLHSRSFSERAFLALADSLPEIKVLQYLDLLWHPGLASAMPMLLEGLRKNTSLIWFDVYNCAPCSVPPTPQDTARCTEGWMQEVERLRYRNRFLLLIRAPKESLPPRGVWPLALTRVATLPDVVFEVLRSKPDLVPSTDREGKAANPGVTTKRKHNGNQRVPALVRKFLAAASRRSASAVTNESLS